MHEPRTVTEVRSEPALSGWNDACARFRAIFGLDAPPAVIQRAIADAEFEYRLLVSKDNPKYLRALFADPANERYEPPAGAAPAPARRSDVELIGRAAKALAAWGASGFTTVDAETYARRTAACEACPHLRAAENRLVYRLTGTDSKKRAVCDLCGCQVQRKARMATESCPGAHPEDPSLTRWGEPMHREA